MKKRLERLLLIGRGREVKYVRKAAGILLLLLPFVLISCVMAGIVGWKVVFMVLGGTLVLLIIVLIGVLLILM